MTNNFPLERGPSVDELIVKYTGKPDPGLIPVLLSIASCASSVTIDTSTIPLRTVPGDLISRTFDDPEIGLTTPEQMATWKQNLNRIIPALQTQINDIPDAPQMRVADAVRYVSALLVAVPVSVPTAIRESGPISFTVGPMAEARKQVANRYGSVFASKASPPLVRFAGGPNRESVLETAAVPLVLEFDHSSTELSLPKLEHRDSTMARAFRLLAFEASQNSFYRKVSSVRAALENRSGTVRFCWLNGTARVNTKIASLAEIAFEQTLQVMDLPRKLTREINVGAKTINAPAFRQRFGSTGTGIRIAVIDGEVKSDHPAFGGRVSLQENFTREPFGSPDPHATGVAGLIAGEDLTLPGISPGASVVNYKVFASDSSLDADDFGGSLAIEHALRDGAEIANCSWGAGPASDGTGREARACNTAWAAGLVIVKSAGNLGPGAGTMTTPADADGVIVVGATDRQGTGVQDYSSRGPTVNAKRPHLIAPGGTELDPLHSCLSVITAGSFGAIGFGTSFATPFVSGAAALLLAQDSNLTPDSLRQKLIAMCRTFANVSPDAQGAGLLDLTLF